MATFYVRKDGSGTHTQIMAAIYAASNGDIIDIGAGTFNENIEFIGKSLTLQGAGKDQTIIQGKYSNDAISGCTWWAGEQTITTTSTADLVVGKTISLSGYLTANSRVASIISGTQFTVDLPTVASSVTKTGVAESTRVTFSVTGSSYNVVGTGKAIQLYNGANQGKFFWFRVTNGSNTQTAPVLVGTGYQVSILSTDTATQIATKFKAAVDAVGDFTTSISSAAVTVTNQGPGPATDASVSPTGTSAPATLAILQQGDLTLTQGSSTFEISASNISGISVGQRITGTGAAAAAIPSGVTVASISASGTTRTITMQNTSNPSNNKFLSTVTAASVVFTTQRSNITLAQLNVNTSAPGTIMFAGSSTGMVIKNLCAIGFDGPTTQDSGALFLGGNAAPGHQNFLIDNCRFVAAGDGAIACSSNPYLVNGTIKNCLIEGKTFTGSEPADVPVFGTYYTNATVKSVGASSTVEIQMKPGIVSGLNIGSMSSPTLFANGVITSVNGNIITLNRTVGAAVNSVIPIFISNFQYIVPNVARNLVYIGQNVVGCQTQNLTFKDNTIKGQSGAFISSSGRKEMFNSAVTIESVGGLIEGNVIDGNFGLGDPNAVGSNYAIRSRQANTIVRNNVNKTSGGRGNAGFYISGTGAVNENNTTVSMGVVQSVQASSATLPVANMDKDQLKYISKVASSPTFSSESNWVQVSYIFKHKTSAKRMIATFRTFDLNKTDEMPLRGGQSGDQYELHKIILCATNRVILSVKRSEISDPSLSDYTLK